LAHINAHKDDILKPFSFLHGQATAFVLAGFNNTYIQEGIGLLQEIHVLIHEDVDFDQSALTEVGKVCAPFPSIIFMSSGKCFRLPLLRRYS
jgi:hypothetical protein